MRTYILRRFLQLIPLLLGITVITFLLIQLVPGDVTDRWPPDIPEATRQAALERAGLDKPWPIQYVLYVKNIVLHGDFGYSVSFKQPVGDVLKSRVLHTLLLASAGALVTWVLAIPLGVMAAVRQHTWVDKSISFGAFLGLSIPEVLMGLLLLMFAYSTGWFPIGGMRSIDWNELGTFARMRDLLHHLFLPAIVVGLIPLAIRMRQMRANLLDVLRLDYVTTARAKGLSENVVIYKHALRNALNPLITLFGFTLGDLLAGSFIAEIIFSWPGLGRVTLDALLAQDTYLVTGAVLMAATMLVIGNLIADVLLAIADPRITYD